MIRKIVILLMMSIYTMLNAGSNLYITKNLIWQNEPYTSLDKNNYDKSINGGKVFDFNGAQEYCQNLIIDNYSDFRLPTKSELYRLGNIKLFSGKIENWEKWFQIESSRRIKKLFIKKALRDKMPTMDGRYSSVGFWTSKRIGKRAFRVRFESGYTSLRPISNKLYVRCVQDISNSKKEIIKESQQELLYEPVIPKKLKKREKKQEKSINKLKKKEQKVKDIIKKTLNIKVVPKDSKIEIENIDRNYYQDIKLIAGEIYNIKISHIGYITKNISFKLEDNKTLHIKLQKTPELGKIDEFNKKVVWVDRQNNLMWQNEVYSIDDKNYYDNRQEMGKVWSWDNAKRYCEDLILANYMDWRLPTVAEIQTIITRKKHGKFFIRQSLVENMPNLDGEYDSVTFWTAKEKDTENAYYAIFELGLVNWFTKSDNYYVRCVRRVGEH